jgi:hypothetical protein
VIFDGKNGVKIAVPAAPAERAAKPSPVGGKMVESGYAFAICGLTVKGDHYALERSAAEH